jgi:hypothetical protein
MLHPVLPSDALTAHGPSLARLLEAAREVCAWPFKRPRPPVERLREALVHLEGGALSEASPAIVCRLRCELLCGPCLRAGRSSLLLEQLPDALACPLCGARSAKQIDR